MERNQQQPNASVKEEKMLRVSGKKLKRTKTKSSRISVIKLGQKKTDKSARLKRLNLRKNGLILKRKKPWEKKKLNKKRRRDRKLENKRNTKPNWRKFKWRKPY
jgi:hypothetical protein